MDTVSGKKGTLACLLVLTERKTRLQLIRRFIPKGTDITDITEEELKNIEEWMNNYLRKLFNGKSSKEMYDIELKQYIS